MKKTYPILLLLTSQTAFASSCLIKDLSASFFSLHRKAVGNNFSVPQRTQVEAKDEERKLKELEVEVNIHNLIVSDSLSELEMIKEYTKGKLSAQREEIRRTKKTISLLLSVKEPARGAHGDYRATTEETSTRIDQAIASLKTSTKKINQIYEQDLASFNKEIEKSFLFFQKKGIPWRKGDKLGYPDKNQEKIASFSQDEMNEYEVRKARFYFHAIVVRLSSEEKAEVSSRNLYQISKLLQVRANILKGTTALTKEIEYLNKALGKQKAQYSEQESILTSNPLIANAHEEALKHKSHSRKMLKEKTLQVLRKKEKIRKIYKNFKSEEIKYFFSNKLTKLILNHEETSPRDELHSFNNYRNVKASLNIGASELELCNTDEYNFKAFCTRFTYQGNQVVASSSIKSRADFHSPMKSMKGDEVKKRDCDEIEHFFSPKTTNKPTIKRHFYMKL